MPTMLEQSQAGAAQQAPNDVKTGTFSSSGSKIGVSMPDRSGQWTTLSQWLRSHPGATVDDAIHAFTGSTANPGVGSAGPAIDPAYVHFTLTLAGSNQTPTLATLYALPYSLSRAQLIDLQQKLFQAGYYGDASFYQSNSQPNYGDPNDPSLGLALQKAATSALRAGTTMDEAISRDASQFAVDMSKVNAANTQGAGDLVNWTQSETLTNPDDIKLMADQIGQKVFGRKLTDVEKSKMVQVIQDQQRVVGQQKADFAYHDAFTKGAFTASQNQVAAGATPSTGAPAPSSGLIMPMANMPWGTGAKAFGFARGARPGVNAHIHDGNDISVPAGTVVVAPVSGTITYTVDSYGDNGTILHGDDGFTYSFVHVRDAGMTVPKGGHVNQGQQIALTGGVPGEHGAGDSTGPHLHLTVRDSSGQAVDPVKHFATAGAPGSTPAPSSDAQQGYTRPGQRNADQQDPGASSPLGVNPLSGTAPTSVPGVPAAPISSSGGSGSVDSDPSLLNSMMAVERKQESNNNYSPNLRSPTGNFGAYQFGEGTWQQAARMAGVNPNDRSPANQDAAASALMSYYFGKYHSWRLVAIAWAGGEGTANKEMAHPGSAYGTHDAVFGFSSGSYGDARLKDLEAMAGQSGNTGASAADAAAMHAAAQQQPGSAATLGAAMTQPVADSNANVQFQTDAASVEASIEAELRKDDPALAGAHDIASSYDAFSQLLSGGTPSVV